MSYDIDHNDSLGSIVNENFSDKTAKILNIAGRLMNVQKTMLYGKINMLYELLEMCDDDDSLNLVEDLIRRFNFMDLGCYQLALNCIADAIIERNFPQDTTVILSMTADYEPDSSQSVIYSLKTILALKGCKLIIINSFKNKQKLINKGYKHFILIDDFIGSGKTCCSRLKNLKNDLNHIEGTTISFFFVAGMKSAVESMRTKDVNIFCAYEMSRGISDHYTGISLQKNINIMKRLEAKLAPQINHTTLSDYNFGYLKSEALFDRCDENIPNNTFPIFWWKEYNTGDNRNTLFIRVQDGY